MINKKCYTLIEYASICITFDFLARKNFTLFSRLPKPRHVGSVSKQSFNLRKEREKERKNDEPWFVFLFNPFSPNLFIPSLPPWLVPPSQFSSSFSVFILFSTPVHFLVWNEFILLSSFPDYLSRTILHSFLCLPSLFFFITFSSFFF